MAQLVAGSRHFSVTRQLAVEGSTISSFAPWGRSAVCGRGKRLCFLPGRANSYRPSNGKPGSRLAPVRSRAADDVEEGVLPPPDDTKLSDLERLVVTTERRINVALTDIVIWLLDALYKDRHYARFYVLETIARVPYFSYVSVLHLYETFGWWRRADYLKVHFAESWNELHHLLIMEALGGDERWVDRFLAQHVATAYFFMSCVMYLLSPRMAYHLMECVELHAFHTYNTFLKAHGRSLKVQPAPEVAVQYYTKGDLYMFDEFQSLRPSGSRRPVISSLYDVFVNIRNDEAEHCKTMRVCQAAGSLHSPHDVYMDDTAHCSGVLECVVTASSAADRLKKLTIEEPLGVVKGDRTDA